jgi:outer membrane protein assembly factor BamB
MVAGGNVYILNEEYKLVAFDAAKGAEQWRSESIDSDEGFGTELIATDDAVIVSDGVRVWSISAETGTEQTEYHAASGTGVKDLLLTEENKLLLTEEQSSSTRLFATDMQTGEQLWEYEYKIEENSSEASLLAAHSETAFLSDTVMHAVNLKDGTRRWSSKTDPNNASIAAEQLYTRVTNKVKSFAIQDTGVDQSWKFKGEKERYDPLAVGNGCVAATSRRRDQSSDDGRNLYVLDSNSGSTKWCQFTGKTGTPAIGGEAVYVSLGNLIYAFDLASGDPLWRYNLSSSTGASIALVDGAVIYSTLSEVGALTTA